MYIAKFGCLFSVVQCVYIYAIKHQSSDLQVPSLNAQQGLLFSWIAINFYYLIFSNVPNEHMLELHIFKEYHMFGILYAELFSKVWRTLLLTLTTIYCHLYAVKYFFQIKLYPTLIMEYVYICAFVYTIMYHLCGTKLSDVSLEISLYYNSQKEKRDVPYFLVYITFQMMLSQLAHKSIKFTVQNLCNVSRLCSSISTCTMMSSIFVGISIQGYE